MSIESIDQPKFYDQTPGSKSADGDAAMAFMQAIKSPLSQPVLVCLQDNPSSPQGNQSSSQAFRTLAQSIYDPSSSTGDDVVTKLEATKLSALSQVDLIVNGESSPAGAGSGPPDQPSSPADYLTALQNGTATGSTPDNLTLPPGTTAAEVAAMNGGLLNNLNQLHIQDGTPAGDAAAQKYGYKDMKTLLADDSPQAAAAAGKILWAARACNNLHEADGAERPDKERNANTLSGITSSHQADNGSTSGAFQNWLKGTSIESQSVFATSRTHADGEGMSNAQIIGNKIANVFKKIFSFICPPLSDLIQTAQDGAEKIRDKHVGDKDAASHDEARLKQDGKQFGADLGELAANAVLDFVAPEAEVVAKVAEETAGTGAKVASKAVGSGAKEARSAARDVKPVSKMPDVSSLVDGLRNRVFGDDFMSKLTGLSKHATRKEKENYVKEKVQDHLNDLLAQLLPQNGKNPASDKSTSKQEELLALLTQMLNTLENAQAPSSLPGSGYIPGPDPSNQPHDRSDPAAPVSRSAASQQPVEATA